MTLIELKARLIALLQSKYPTKKYKYYSMAVVNFNSRKNRVLFYITIMQEKTNEAEILEMIQSIRDLFGLYVKIGDRAVKVENFDWSYTGTYRNIPEISIELQWFERIEHKNDAPLMERIETKKEWRN